MADDRVSRARAEVCARAQTLVGMPFRLHGRGDDGIDCVGVVAHALALERVPTGYALRSADAAAVADVAKALGLIAGGPGLCAGDVVVLRPGPAQLHLGVWTGVSLIHADATLRRVVETPGPIAAPRIAVWRMKEE